MCACSAGTSTHLRGATDRRCTVGCAASAHCARALAVCSCCWSGQQEAGRGRADLGGCTWLALLPPLERGHLPAPPAGHSQLVHPHPVLEPCPMARAPQSGWVQPRLWPHTLRPGRCTPTSHKPVGPGDVQHDSLCGSHGSHLGYSGRSPAPSPAPCSAGCDWPCSA